MSPLLTHCIVKVIRNTKAFTWSMLGKYINGDFVKYIPMQDSYMNLSSYYTEIIVEYFVLVSYGAEILHLYSKRLTPFPKNIVNLN
jgi:hypothetical protein